MGTLLYYDCISTFKRTYYKDLLSIEHLMGGEVHYNKLTYTNGASDEFANFWGYQLEKDGTLYLLPSKDPHGNTIKLNDTLPILVTESVKVSNRSKAYMLIKKYNIAKFKPIKSMNFRDLIDKMSELQHTNPEHQKLLTFIGFASMFDRANFRVSTPAGFGKDSIVTVFNNLVGGAIGIVQPTLAKLEYRTHAKWLVVNEVIDVGTNEWNLIQQFLLDTGDHKPEVEKHSRATTNGVKETLDVSKMSLTLFYNDINHYPKPTEYFDFVTRKAVLDRFPAFRLYGTITEDFNQTKDLNLDRYVKEHIEEYKEIVYSITYYREFFNRELKCYNADKLRSVPPRWKTNIGRLLKIIDLYCKDQNEFDYWINVINDSLYDYETMIEFGKKYAEIKERHGKSVLFFDLKAELNKYKTYKDKLAYMQGFDFTKRETKKVKEETNSFWSTA